MKLLSALQYFGTKARIARVLGISKQAVQTWGEDVPQRYAYELERITAGTLKALWPPPDRPKMTGRPAFPAPRD